ncbi:hypothetical protein ACQ4PT_026332 [Festuca glaucescens]
MAGSCSGQSRRRGEEGPSLLEMGGWGGAAGERTQRPKRQAPKRPRSFGEPASGNESMGVELDLSDKPVRLGVRSRRYALLADDGVVKVLNLEEGGSFTNSSAEDMLKAL